MAKSGSTVSAAANSKVNAVNPKESEKMSEFQMYKLTLSALFNLTTGSTTSKQITKDHAEKFVNDDMEIYPAAIKNISDALKNNDDIFFVMTAEKFSIKSVADRGRSVGQEKEHHFYDMMIMIPDENTENIIKKIITDEVERQAGDEKAPKTKAAAKPDIKSAADMSMDDFKAMAAADRSKMKAAKEKALESAETRKNNKKNAEKAVITPKV